jgi:hypothetical protein
MSIVKEMSTRLVPVTAVRWGPDWDHMKAAAEYLGSQGIMFQLITATEDQVARGVDVMPELVLFDAHYRPHQVVFSQWVVLYPGYRNFRVVDNQTLHKEFRFLADESEDFIQVAEEGARS